MHGASVPAQRLGDRCRHTPRRTTPGVFCVTDVLLVCLPGRPPGLGSLCLEVGLEVGGAVPLDPPMLGRRHMVVRGVGAAGGVSGKDTPSRGWNLPARWFAPRSSRWAEFGRRPRDSRHPNEPRATREARRLSRSRAKCPLPTLPSDPAASRAAGGCVRRALDRCEDVVHRMRKRSQTCIRGGVAVAERRRLSCAGAANITLGRLDLESLEAVGWSNRGRPVERV